VAASPQHPTSGEPDAAPAHLRAVNALVLSPHFDDAVLSCGSWLERHPGTIVATVCSGAPGSGIPADPAWDALALFDSADAAATARRAEDQEALGMLGAEQRLLGFLDGAYKARAGRSHEDPDADGSFEEELSRSINGLLDEVRPEKCLVPVGLIHPDHIATRRAALDSLRARPTIRSMLYLDLPYAMASEQAARDQLDAIIATGVQLSEDPGPGPSTGEVKVRAAGCYRSQLPLLEKVFGETLWRSLEPGAERLFRMG
jgi:LmbE family N-acetylglucosaminyl deacetylase